MLVLWSMRAHNSFQPTRRLRRLQKFVLRASIDVFSRTCRTNADGRGRSQILSGTIQMEDLSRDAAYVRCAKNQAEPSDQLRDFLTWFGTYLQGQGDLVSRSTTQKIHIVTLTIPIINLLTKSISPPDPPSKASRDASARGPPPYNFKKITRNSLELEQYFDCNRLQ